MIKCDKGHEHPSFVMDKVTFVEHVGTCHVVYTRLSDKEIIRRHPELAAPTDG